MTAQMKAIARLAATALVLPRVASLRVRAAVLGLDAAFADSMQSLSKIPGLRGRYLRAAFLRQVLTDSAPDVTIEAGTLLSKAGATFAAENGASDQQLMAIFGWTNAEQAAVYTRTANRAKMAAMGVGMLEPEDDIGDQT